MRQAVLGAIWVLVALSVCVPRLDAVDADLRILTYPIGIVTGELPVEVDLGTTGEPAELFLNGERVCTMDAASTRCTVDLGPDPHLHLMELLRFDDRGLVSAQAVRWVNRPGQEAELMLQLGERSPQGICGGRASWSHPLKQDPVLLEVTENGLNLLIQEDGRSFRFPCPDVRVPHVLAASAIFPDGRRAEAVSLSGGFSGSAETGLTAVALVTDSKKPGACEEVLQYLPEGVTLAGRQKFEVVIVLDPSAGYQTLMRTGWSTSGLPQTSSTTKQFDQLVQHGSKGSEPKPKVSWIKSESSLMDAEKLWFVTPNKELHRVNGFGQGKMNWLRLLFQFGPTKLKGEPRLADAVAASGLIAASGPQQRAVVLFLGSKSHQDGSLFTPRQVQSYLAEVGVPLVVMRNGKLRDDGWPAGVPVKSMEGMAEALLSLQNDLTAQCVAWFPGHMHTNEISTSLPDEVIMAGRGGVQPGSTLEVWQRVETQLAASAEPGAVSPTAEPAGRGEVEITATTVLLWATDSAGRPVAGLQPSAIEVSEDGISVTVLDLEPIASGGLGSSASAVSQETAPSPTPVGVEPAPMPVAIYVDRRLSGTAEVGPALQALAEDADWLTSLGPVDVGVADGTLSTILEGSTDPEELRKVLADLKDEGAGPAHHRAYPDPIPARHPHLSGPHRRTHALRRRRHERHGSHSGR